MIYYGKALSSSGPKLTAVHVNVGLPDKFHIQTFDCLPMPSNIHPIPPNTKVLGAYATPDPNRLKPFFMLLF